MGLIKVQKNVNDKAMAREQRKLDVAKRETFEAMKELREKRRATGAKRRRGQTGAIHYDALMNAVDQMGPEVLGNAGREFWDFEARKNPWMTEDGVAPGTDSINGRKNRIGKVSEKMIGGVWYHWDERKQDWVEGEVKKRKGIR